MAKVLHYFYGSVLGPPVECYRVHGGDLFAHTMTRGKTMFIAGLSYLVS
ncbi:hypothetical protein [Bacillus sp. Marseille-Q1617]|nr:hypothetical protein [Bacillus sp. Marseille-Q1617]